MYAASFGITVSKYETQLTPSFVLTLKSICCLIASESKFKLWVVVFCAFIE